VKVGPEKPEEAVNVEPVNVGPEKPEEAVIDALT
jgi:hypothetical protein